MITGKELCDKITKQKISSKEPRLPKVNSVNISLGNKVLYVGKSGGNFYSRLKQHLGHESSKTYALHLNLWQKVIIGRDIQLRLYYFSFDNIKSGINNELLETIETALHTELKPLLGRIGH